MYSVRKFSNLNFSTPLSAICGEVLTNNSTFHAQICQYFAGNHSNLKHKQPNFFQYEGQRKRMLRKKLSYHTLK